MNGNSLEYFEPIEGRYHHGGLFGKRYKNQQNKHDGFLYESYGILNLRDKLLGRTIFDFVTSDINPYLNNKMKPDSFIIEENGFANEINDRKEVKRFSLNIDLSWLKRLDVYVEISKNIESVIYADIIQDEITDKRFSYKIFYDGCFHDSYEILGNKVEYMSVLLSVPFRYNDKNKMVAMIEHEIKHGHDLLMEKFITNHINRDIVEFNNMFQCGSCYITTFWLYDERNMKTFIFKLDAEHIMSCFRDIIYYLNLGEIQAHLTNYRREIEDIKIGDCNKSETDMNYRGIRYFLEMLKTVVNKNIKCRFGELYGNEFEKIYGCDNDIETNISFRYKGKYNEVTFDKICDFYINRLNKYFFKNADKIYSEIMTSHD